MTTLLLCNPYFIRDDPVTRRAMDIYPLLGHGYLASHLEGRGYSTAILDTTFDRDMSSYESALAALRPAIVGVYGHVLSRDNAFRFAQRAREEGLLTVAGGPDATGYYDDYLRNGFDVVVRSEGEATAAELLDWHAAGARLQELSRIRGIAFRDEQGNVVLNEGRPYIADLDSLPFPRRDEEVYRPYLDAWRRTHGYLSLHLIGARGCPFDCAFCYRPVFGRLYRRRSPENIVRELEQLTDRFGARHFRFVDDTFVVHKQWVAELSALIRQRLPGLSFDVLSRSDLMTDELAEALAGMGVRRIYFGMESGSDEVLRHMHKGIRAEESVRAAETVRRHGMEFLSWIMLGYPGEEKKDVYATRDMLVNIKPDVLSISVAFPIRNTPFYEEVKDRIVQKRPFWKRTAENRLVFRGRYSSLFYLFAQRWIYKDVELAKRRRGLLTRPFHLLLRLAFQVGMELFSHVRNGRSASPGAMKPPPRDEDIIELQAVSSGSDQR